MTTRTDRLWLSRMVGERFHRDDEGRPIREGRTPAEYLAPGEIDYKPCAYPGSRAGKPMNVSALRQAAAHWDEILDAQAELRAAYERTRGYGPDVMDLWRVAQLGSSLPWLYILRGETTPGFVASLSKVTLGMGLLAQRMLARQLAEGWVPPAFTVETLCELAEASGTLVGATEVCSAPERMLGEYFAVFVAPRDHTARLPAGALAFGAHYCHLKLGLWIYGLARRFLYADLDSALAGRAFAAELAALREAPVEPPDFDALDPAEPVAPATRAAWLAGLARLVLPLSPDGADAPLADLVMRLAVTVGDRPPPDLAIADAVPADARDRVAHAVAGFIELDATFAEIVAHVEAGLRRAADAAPLDGEPDAAERDRILIAPPRRLVAALVAR